MDFVKRPVVIIIASICIAASFFVGGIFTGKLIEQTENDTDLNCTAVKGEYQKCIDDLEPLWKFCQVFVGKNCSEVSSCNKHCLYKYGADLKTCPCKVQSGVEVKNCNLKLRINVERGVHVQSVIASMKVKTKQRFLPQPPSPSQPLKLRNFQIRHPCKPHPKVDHYFLTETSTLGLSQ